MVNFNNDTEQNPIRGQSSLGTEYKRRYKEGQNIDRISLAQVVKVHHRYNTVEVILFPRGESTSEGYYTEGKFSAKLPVEFGGTTSEGNPFGQTTPIEIGSLVLVGFVEGSKSTPIVISIYSKSDESYELSRSPVAESDPNVESLKKYTDQAFKVYPSLTYENIDGRGNRTMSFTGKSFFVSDADSDPNMSGVTDDGNGTGYEDLKTSYYYSGKLIEPKEGKAPTILFKHQGDITTEALEGQGNDDHTLMFFIDQDGTFRTSMLDKSENWRSLFEISKDGRQTIKFQKDTKGVVGSNDYNSISIDEYGIEIVVGDKYLRITKDGTTGNLGLGSGGSLSPELEGVLKDLEETILHMQTGIEQNDESIRIYAEKVSTLDDTLILRLAEWEIEAEQIRQSVSETRINDLINSGLAELSDSLTDLFEESGALQEVIDRISSDSIVTPSEKMELAIQWDMIQAEYGSYKSQAESIDVDTAAYTFAYTNLEAFIEPLLENMGETTSILPSNLRVSFSRYYTTRSELLYSVFTKLSSQITEAANTAIEAGRTAGEALATAQQNFSDGYRIMDELSTMALDNRITSAEKYTVRSYYRDIVSEYPSFISQADDFGVSDITYGLAYENIVLMIDTTYRLFNDMSTGSDVDGEALVSAFNDYYAARTSLNSNIIAKSRDILLQYQGDMENYQAEIVNTKNEVRLLAQSVITQGKSIELANAQLSVMPGRIQSSTSNTQLYREVTSGGSLNATGSNLYVIKDSLPGSLDVNTGNTISTSDGDRVSAFIAANPLVTYTAQIFGNNSNNVITMVFYDENRQYLSGKNVSGSSNRLTLQAESPEGTAYLKVSTRRTEDIQLLVERGTGSSYFMLSVEDLVDNVLYATEEKDRRQAVYVEMDNIRIEAETNDVIFYETVVTMASDMRLTPNEKSMLETEYNDIQTEFQQISTTAESQGVDTFIFRSNYLTLTNRVDDYLENMSTTELLTNTEVLPMIFEDYYDAKGGVIDIISENAKDAYDASLDLLNDVTNSAIEAERIAQSVRDKAEQSAQSVDIVTQMIAEAKEAESIQLNQVTTYVSDGILTSAELVRLSGYIADAEEMNTILKAQARLYALNTTDYDSAYGTLMTIYDSLNHSDNALKDLPITDNSFTVAWSSYHRERQNLLDGILLGAKGEFGILTEQADILGQEAERRKGELQNVDEEIRILEQTTITNQEASEQGILAQVSTMYVGQGEYGEFVSNVATNFLQKDDAFLFEFKQALEGEIGQVSKETAEQFAEYNRYIKFDQGRIILSADGQNDSIIIDNNRMSFMQGGVEVAFIAGQEMQINQGIFTNSAVIAGFNFSNIDNDPNILGIRWG